MARLGRRQPVPARAMGSSPVFQDTRDSGQLCRVAGRVGQCQVRYTRRGARHKGNFGPGPDPLRRVVDPLKGPVGNRHAGDPNADKGGVSIAARARAATRTHFNGRFGASGAPQWTQLNLAAKTLTGKVIQKRCNPELAPVLRSDIDLNDKKGWSSAFRNAPPQAAVGPSMRRSRDWGGCWRARKELNNGNYNLCV